MQMKTTAKKILNLAVIIERDESGYYVGTVPSLRSCYTQAKTLPKLYERLQEAVSLSVEIERTLFKKGIKPNQFVGVQTIEFVS